MDNNLEFKEYFITFMDCMDFGFIMTTINYHQHINEIPYEGNEKWYTKDQIDQLISEIETKILKDKNNLIMFSDPNTVGYSGDYQRQKVIDFINQAEVLYSNQVQHPKHPEDSIFHLIGFKIDLDSEANQKLIPLYLTDKDSSLRKLVQDLCKFKNSFT